MPQRRCFYLLASLFVTGLIKKIWMNFVEKKSKQINLGKRNNDFPSFYVKLSLMAPEF